MKRREFLLLCGCAGLGVAGGLGVTTTSRAAAPNNHDVLKTPRTRWMYGTPTIGCARLPGIEPPFAPPEPDETALFV